MRVLSTQVLPNANIYSHNPVLRIRLDIGDYEDVASSELPGFCASLVEILPGLKSHSCSRGYPGGFVERLKEGTYLAHVFEHVAIELQCQAGYQVGFGKTRGSGKRGVYDVVIGYRTAAAAVASVLAAEQLLLAVLNGQAYDCAEAVRRVRSEGERSRLGPSTEALYDAARRRRIPVTRVEGEDLLILGYGRKQQRLWATVTGRTGALGADLAGDKELTKRVLAEGGLPVPDGLVAEDAAEAARAVSLLGGPVAIKPVNGNQGKGVTLNISAPAAAERAYHIAAQYDRRVVVEEYVTGRQYRLCVVNGKLEAAAERIPAYVIGDGSHSVEQLVAMANLDPLRGEGHEKPLTKIRIDAVAVTVLARQGLAPDGVPGKGKVVYIRDNANLSTGGTAVDVTDIVHPDNALLAERAARLIGLDIAGVDLVAADITKPITAGNGAIIEVNAAPGIRMHHYPSAGKSRDVAARVIDYLFPEGEGRIPIIAVTGTNGKTTVTRMISHIWQTAGYAAGMTTTDGIYIGGRKILAGDTTGPTSARTVLTDPLTEVAVLETARGGIMRGGLGFDACDVGVVTNISEDHFGQDGIEDLEDLIYVKSLIVEALRPGGVALLNADDPCVMAMLARARGEVVLFSTEPDNIIIRRHLSVGGKAFFVRDGTIYAACGSLGRSIVRVSDVPVTLGGIAIHNIQNAVIAAASCYCLKVPLSYIRKGLSTFEVNPGRLNLMTVGDFRVCVDYGHNPAGYKALIHTAKRLGAKRLVGVIGAPGDRRDDVTVNVGRIAGQGFDYIYVKEDSDLRGREPGQIAALLRQGVLQVGLPEASVEVVLAEDEAVRTALVAAQPGDLIVIFYEKYDRVMGVIDAFRHEWRERPESSFVDFSPRIAGVHTL
ncbi:MAG TPA: cyanophycin synthetase [Selenomonadales bacterium]|nr:cyanophycin synthetase [Selenomonadales bacterium]